jgi:hypothetical protein
VKRPGARWTARDWLLAQALDTYERLLCPHCGNMLTEAMDPELEHQWVAPLPMRCHPCTAIDARAEGYKESDAPNALRFSAHRRVPAREGGA